AELSFRIVPPNRSLRSDSTSNCRRKAMDIRRVNPWLVLVIVGLAQFVVVLDATIVNVALPSIQRGLHFSTPNLPWIVNASTLTFGGFLMLGGRAADLLGRRSEERRVGH